MKQRIANQSHTIEITWKEFKSYDDAKDQYKIIYLVVMKGKPDYLGICKLSVFGGDRRWIGGRWRSPRYGLSYKHWIDAALANGSKLFVGKVEKSSERLLASIEKFLILKYLPESNKRKAKVQGNIALKHVGKFPKFLKN